MILKNVNGHVLVAVGLLGIASYQMMLRIFHPPILSNDFIHGVWLGACIALEILGLILLRKSRRGHAAPM